MDQKIFLSGLPAGLRAELVQRSDAAGLRHLGLHAGLIVALGTAVAAGVPGWPLLLLPLGIALAFLFTLQHECTHQTPFATPWLNEVAGHVCGAVLIQPFLWFRSFHMAHHRHTNLPGRDPELDGDKPETWADLMWHLSCIAYWRDKLVVVWTNAFGQITAEYVPAPARPRLRREARMMLAFLAGAAVFSLTVSPVLLWIWLLPLALGFPLLRLYLLAEHGRCPTVANMFENTRTTFTTRTLRFLAWNMPYHAEHHVFPQVPFHRLPDLHRLTRAHLRQTEPGYVAFTRHYVRGLRG